ncbi:MAG: nucleotidyltransferase family protein [Clostridia bacterium]|nr:nucleotidyltransferase family protein [Clostridia bacterium]
MTETFLDMVYLFSCGARGITPVLSRQIDIISVYRMAVKQGVWQVVFLAIKDLYKNDKIDVDEELFNKWNSSFIYSVGLSCRKNDIMHKTINMLEGKGIKCCILKGESVSRFYSVPACRISSDTDILIDGKNEKRCAKLLSEYGYKVQTRLKGSHHFECEHALGGILEVHVSMYGDITDDICFDRKITYNEGYEQIKTDDDTVLSTLGITDGIIFLMLHFIKHFLSKGAGIRQLNDILLYIEYYYEKIDWQRVNSLMKYLKFEKFIDAVICIGKRYLNFDEALFPNANASDKIIQDILTDMENGGAFGRCEKEREHFYKIYIKERFNRFKSGDYNKYMNKFYRPDIMKKLFPSKNFMAINFKYVEKYPILVPISWVHRYMQNAVKILRKEQSAVQYIRYVDHDYENETEKKRMEIIRELDMV